jgi:hypothetical protein
MQKIPVDALRLALDNRDKGTNGARPDLLDFWTDTSEYVALNIRVQNPIPAQFQAVPVSQKMRPARPANELPLRSQGEGGRSAVR